MTKAEAQFGLKKEKKKEKKEECSKIQEEKENTIKAFFCVIINMSITCI